MVIRVTISCSVIYVIFSFFAYITFSFNVEELKHVNYEVDISGTPVKRDEINHPAVYITSRSGQEFQCILPQLIEEEILEKELKNEKDVDVVDLLKPLRRSPCLYKIKDWWTYEFCFGLYIKQFHVEDGQIVGQTLTLGLYDSDYDWNNETDQAKFKHAKQKYHSQYYTNGTKCDLTGQPRTAEVRIYCEEDAGNYIHRVDEPGTCNYLITVHTSQLCSHPLLKPLSSNKAHSIACRPLLNEEQYSTYLEKLKDKKVVAEEQRKEFLTKQKDKIRVLKKEKIVPVDGGGNIEVKIITAGIFDIEDEKNFQTLTPEETDQYRNLIMSTFSKENEILQEMERHNKLKNNYKFTWDDSEETDQKDTTDKKED